MDALKTKYQAVGTATSEKNEVLTPGDDCCWVEGNDVLLVIHEPGTETGQT
jgi:hypothetical protein